MPTQDVERYRQKAAECEDEAAKATSASAKEAWLQAAEEWRKLARAAEEKPAGAKAVSNPALQSTGHDPS
ncbi:hypothetical protein BEL01nite_10510 [Bradyrhizobium elkanii]|jgi:hypothetical protein|nr:hypothetical protein BEL01nite_10510 [Bradyrhizobium elkanii]